MSITERKQMETALQESEERFKALVTLSPDALYLHADGRVIFANPAMCRLMGAGEPGQLLGKSVFDIVHPDFHALVRKRLEMLSEGQPISMIAEKFVRLDGSSVDVEVSAVRLGFGGRDAIQVIARDVTARKQAQKHIQQLNRVYSVLSNINQTIIREKDAQKLFETACGVAVKQGDFRMAWVGMLDPVTRRIELAASAGADHDTVEILNAILGDDEVHCKCAFTIQALETGRHGVCNDIERDPRTASWRAPALERGYRSMASLPLKLGEKIVGTFNLYAGEPDFFDAEELALLDELAADVSFSLKVHEREKERQRIDEELRWKTAFLEAQVHSALDGILVVDNRGKIILRNQRFRDMWKVPPDLADIEADARSLQFAVAQAKYPAQFAERVAYLYAHPHEISRDEIELLDGRVFDRYSAPVQDEGGKYFGRIWTFRDITRQKQSEAALRLGEAQLRATFENAAMGIALVNPDGRPVKCNPALSRMLGYSEEELSRMTFPQFTHPDDVETDLRLYHSLLAGERDHYEIEKRYLRKDGQIMWGRLTVSLVKQPDGNPFLAIGMVEDITDRHKLEEQFRQAQKMEAIGQLAGGVAHDFNNILAVIQLQSGMLGADETLTSAQREVTAEIVRAAERAANLTRQLLMFSRKQAIRPENLDLNDVVSNMTRMLHRILGEDISLAANYASHLPLIFADVGMIEQIILNLAVNSRDAMPGGGKLTIATGTETLKPDETDQTAQALPGLYVCLCVTDTGTGIPPEILPRIFEPFFTTKEVGKGTGIGLATVYGIVQQHRGRINVTSEVNQGTTFHVYFPAVTDAVTNEKTESTLAKLPRGKETILLVEDELPLRTSVGCTLEYCGYTVLPAESGREALKVWHEHKDQIQLVLTDIVMPEGMSGFELARQLRIEKPQLKIVYTSGYIGELAGKETNLVEGLNFLQKPFIAQALAETLRKNLDQN